MSLVQGIYKAVYGLNLLILCLIEKDQQRARTQFQQNRQEIEKAYAWAVTHLQGDVSEGISVETGSRSADEGSRLVGPGHP